MMTDHRKNLVYEQRATRSIWCMKSEHRSSRDMPQIIATGSCCDYVHVQRELNIMWSTHPKKKKRHLGQTAAGSAAVSTGDASWKTWAGPFPSLAAPWHSHPVAGMQVRKCGREKNKMA
jgi:hypothetical protein